MTIPSGARTPVRRNSLPRGPQHTRTHRPAALTRRVATATVPLAVLAAGAVPAPGSVGTGARAGHAAAPAGDRVSTPGGSRASAVTLLSATRRVDPAPPAVEAYGGASGLPAGRLRGDVVGAATSAGGRGYWVVDARGAVSAHGAAGHYGSLPASRHAGRIVGIAAAAGGRGYWLVSASGGVYPFGDARFHGSLAGEHRHSPVVGIAAAHGGAGYWLATATGGVYGFGDAAFEGSPNSEGLRHHAPIVGIAAARGQGYWLAAVNGSVYEYGNAPFRGSLPMRHQHAEVTAIAATPSGRGYWLAGRDGSVYPFGDARFAGSAAPEAHSAEVTAIAATGPGGYLEVSAAAHRAATRRAGRAATHSAAARRSHPQPAASVSLGDFLVTCYDLQGITASGVPVSTATVAVDPSVVPMGAKIDISGVGVRVAQDTGGAIIGRHLDIWEPSYQTCVNWGARTEQVTLLRR